MHRNQTNAVIKSSHTLNNRMRTMLRAIIILSALFSVCVQAQTPSPQGAEVYFISPHDGDTVSSPVIIKFGLKNMGIAPAGINVENTGHHHLLIDAGLPPLDQPIPSDDHHKHFGKGQTETTLELTPGKHTLQLLLGDYTHTPHSPPVMSKQITILVK